MALIDLKTDFRSLKFGLGQASDKPGGGYSNQPYVVKPIPDYDEDASNIFNTGGPDSLLRGGLMAPIKAIDDVSRLTKMFFDLKSPNGLLFTAKQNVLSRNSVKTEASKGLGTAGGTVNQGLYLPTSTILQSGVGFTGTHLNLLGLNPFAPGLDNDSYQAQRVNGGLMKYETVAKFNNKASSNDVKEIAATPGVLDPLHDVFENDPLILGTEGFRPTANPFPRYLEEPQPARVEGEFTNRLLNIWYNKQQQVTDDTIVLDYGGGPGSILGVGKTQIPFGQRTGINNPLAKGSKQQQDFFYGREKGNSQILTGAYNTANNLTLYRATQLAAKSTLLDLKELSDDFDPTGTEGYKVSRTYNKDEGALTRKPSEINDSKEKHQLINTTSDYLSDPYFTQLQTFQTQFTGSDFTDDADKNILTKGGASPYVSNNNLITNVSTVGIGDLFGNGDRPTPNIYDSLKNSTSENSATLKYQFLTRDVPGADNMNEEMDFSKYSFGSDFNVYNPLSWPTTTDLQSANNSATWTQGMLISQQSNKGKISGNPTLQDFRVPLLEKSTSSTIMSLAPDYTDPNRVIDNRVGIGNPGKARNVYNYEVQEDGMDLINSRPFYSDTSPTHGTVNDGSGNFGNDLCKFTIGLLKNDGSGESNFIQFRAYIDDFSDAYSADWGDVQYVGRGDKFYNYKGFNRSISMGWTVHASSKGELIPMYKKLNYLASGLAPDYSAGGFMKGNLARLSVGGYVYNQLGIIKSITYTIPQESPWEIGVNIDANGKFDSEVKELPHMIKVTGFEFVPIQYDVARKGKTKFIQLLAKNGTNWSSGMQMPDEQAEAIAKQKQIKENAAKEKAKADLKKFKAEEAARKKAKEQKALGVLQLQEFNAKQFNSFNTTDNTRVDPSYIGTDAFTKFNNPYQKKY